jgi:tRNA nucleotidyltransferase (CCA-adding enzyme)
MSPPLQAAVSAAQELAREEGKRLYLVGGAVRDLLLSRGIGDVDLVLERGALAFAKRLGARLGVRPRVHERFRTATLELASGPRLDIAEARSETYDRPGALPRVRPAAALAEDLGRRDFTVNAMALEIAPRWLSRPVDPFGGRADLRRRTLRLLSPRSPHDDPTRAFRAIRYANRLGFSIEARSRLWIREALTAGSFDGVSGDRLRRELALIFSEEGWAGAAARMRRLGVSAILHPALSGGGGLRMRLSRAERLARRLRASWLSALLTWASDLSEENAAELAARLAFAGSARQVLRGWPAALRSLGGLSRLAPALTHARIERLSLEERVAAAATLPASDRRALLAQAEKRVALRIRGRDLLAAGVRPGPRVGFALSKTLAARRDGRISEEDELSFALKAVRRSP